MRFFLIVLYLIPLSLFGQHFHRPADGRITVDVGLGVSSYEGDLAPFAFRGSLGKAAPAVFIGGKFLFTEWMAARVRYSTSRIAASDQNSASASRQIRNLSFRSPIRDYSVGLEFRPPKWIEAQKYFAPLFMEVFLCFQFNPQAKINGDWVDLQPLSTEGQGIPSLNGTAPYKLTQFSTPMGLGMNFNFTRYLSFSFNFTWHKTYTDYLDDVSGYYVDPSILNEFKGPLAAQLANRKNELDPSYDVLMDAGNSRGEPRNNDAFIFWSAHINYKIPTKVEREYFKKVKCPHKD